MTQNQTLQPAQRGPPQEEDNKTKARSLIETAIDQLATALENGHSQILKEYLATMARFHPYSAGNQLLIHLQRPTATHIAGYQTWKKLGRQVKKGEKGILIQAPIQYRYTTTTDKTRNNREEDNTVTVTRLSGFKPAHVFDITQTDGPDLPEFPTVQGSPGEHLERLKTAIHKRSITLNYSDDMGGAIGRSSGGRITIQTGLPPAEEFSALVHELAHELLHHGPNRQETTKTMRETQAEAVAFVVNTAIGLETSTTSSDYIQLYQGKKQTLAESLHAIRQAANTILTELDIKKTNGHEEA